MKIEPISSAQDLSSIKATLHCFLYQYFGTPGPETQQEKWVEPGATEQFSFPAAHGKLLQFLKKQQVFE